LRARTNYAGNDLAVYRDQIDEIARDRDAARSARCQPTARVEVGGAARRRRCR
jgi:hypothetical protein